MIDDREGMRVEEGRKERGGKERGRGTEKRKPSVRNS